MAVKRSKTRSRTRSKRGGKQRTRSRRYRKTSRKSRTRTYRGGNIDDLEHFLLNEPTNRNNTILSDRDIESRIESVAAFAHVFNDDHKYDDLLREIKPLLRKYNISDLHVSNLSNDYGEYLYDYDESVLNPIMNAYRSSSGYLLK